MLSLATGVAVAEALAQRFGIEARLKWPNDVLVRGRKITGILLESRMTGTPRAAIADPAAPGIFSRPPADEAGLAAPGTIHPATTTPVTIIGIGLNLAQRAFPDALEGRATSVAIETGSAPDREAVLTALLAEFDRWRDCLEGEGFGPVRARWVALSETIGRSVSAGGAAGVAVDLDLDGALIVVDGARCHRIASGDVVEGEHAPRG
jgi:BirA family biotin operon repressor/biotin-[acetyl-CoA-carboxylase] ligase